MNNSEVSLVEVGKSSVRLSAGLIKKLHKYLAGSNYISYFKNIDMLIQDEKDFYEVTKKDFLGILEKICDDSDRKAVAGEMKGYDSSFVQFVDDYNLVLSEYKRVRKKNFASGILVDDSDFFCRSLLRNKENILNFLDVAFELDNKYKSFYRFRDLCGAKEGIIESLKYFCSQEEIENFEVKYNIEMENNNIMGMQGLLEKAQGLILEHWEAYVTNIDGYVPGQPIKFIGHSMRSSDFKGKFWTRFVSASLFTEKLTDTYMMGFGFILHPCNIVGAQSSDMYIDNDALNVESMLCYSLIKKIDGPEKILAECYSLKEENKRNKDNRPVYSEVVIDGFNPWAIFCFTDGSKSLNGNYKSAYELQKKFPDLKVIEIDETLYKSDEELLGWKRNLIFNIQKRERGKLDLSFKISDISGDVVNSYEWFWKKFMELKKSSDYTEEDIINLYNRNKALLWYVDYDNLFEKYDRDEREVIFNHNYNLRFKNIFSGNFKMFRLEEIYRNLGKYKDDSRFDEYIPGLTDFLKIYAEVSIDGELEKRICKCKSILEVNELLVDRLKVQDNDLMSEINGCQTKLSCYERELGDKCLMCDKYNESKKIIDNEFWYSIACRDIERLVDFRNLKEEELERICSVESNLKGILDEKEIELVKLNKYKIINYFKIKKIKQEKVADNKLIDKVRKEKEFLVNDIEGIVSEINGVKGKFSEETGLAFDEFLDKLSEARQIVREGSFDFLNEDIGRLRGKISSVNCELEGLVARKDRYESLIMPSVLVDSGKKR